MKFVLQTINTELDTPDVIGEALRRQTFVGEGLGCYQTFEVGSDWVLMSIEPDAWGTYNHRYINRWNGIICTFFWDGDGTLRYTFPDGSFVINYDCKCTYDWRYYAKEGL